MFPEDQEEVVDSAREFIEEASIADGLEQEKKPQPDGAVPGGVGTGLESDIVAAAMEHIEEASIADGRVS